jgi:hypothetical protein
MGQVSSSYDTLAMYFDVAGSCASAGGVYCMYCLPEVKSAPTGTNRKQTSSYNYITVLLFAVPICVWCNLIYVS